MASSTAKVLLSAVVGASDRSNAAKAVGITSVFKSDIEAIIALSENATSHAAISERKNTEVQRKIGASETS